MCFNSHFPGGPGLAGTSMSPFWSLLELRVMEVVVTTGAIRHANLQSKCHHQQTNTQIITGRMPFLSPNQQSLTNTEGKTVNVCSCIDSCCTLYFVLVFVHEHPVRPPGL